MAQTLASTEIRGGGEVGSKHARHARHRRVACAATLRRARIHGSGRMHPGGPTAVERRAHAGVISQMACGRYEPVLTESTPLDSPRHGSARPTLCEPWWEPAQQV